MTAVTDYWAVPHPHVHICCSHTLWLYCSYYMLTGTYYTCVFDMPTLAGGGPDESLTSSDSEKVVSVCVHVCVCACMRVYLLVFVGVCAVVHSECMLTGVKANKTQMFDLSDCF